MQSWGDAYRRLRLQSRFLAWFGLNGRLPGPNDFTFRAYNLVFNGLKGLAVGSGFGGPVSELVQIFNKGAVILGITSAAYLDQTIGAMVGTLAYPPSPTPGRRDLYNLNFQFTDGELVTPAGNVIAVGPGAMSNVAAAVNADALLGEGQKDEFPRDLLVPPSTGFIVQASSVIPNDLPRLFVHVVFHCVIPKG